MNDDKLIDEMRSMDCDEATTADSYYEQFISAVRKHDGWISVEDRLPKFGRPYLLKRKDSATPFVRFIYHESDLTESYITHWHPLPPQSKDE